MSEKEILLALLITQRQIMSSLDNLNAITTKIAADIDTKLAADAATIAAQAATIADLQNQLSQFQNDQQTIDADVATLTAADAKLV